MGRFNPGDQAIINGQIVEITSWPANDDPSAFAEYVLNISGGGTSRFTNQVAMINAQPFSLANTAADVTAVESEDDTGAVVTPSTDGE